MWWTRFFILAAVLFTVCAGEKVRLCAPADISPSACTSLEKSDSPLKCQRVVDSADCAIKLAEGRADFGVFTADEVLLTHHFYPTGMQVVAQLKNRENNFDEFEFQSVVVVPKSYIPTEGAFGGLVGSGFCHPGFSKTQLWNDHVLKYFEQKVLSNVCINVVTVAENEIINLKDFFKTGCRPGEWVPDSDIDEALKKKYPQLCELCDNKEECRYNRLDKHGHMGALDCLTSGRGKVAYASLQYVKQYFAPNQSTKKMSDYQFLCENGTVVPLDHSSPCTWFKQPWKVILSREDKANQVTTILEQATRTSFSSQSWDESLHGILFSVDSPFVYSNYTSLTHYLSMGRDPVIELPKSQCNEEIRWCTTSQVETNKCNWTSAAAQTLGIKPIISCIPAKDHFECYDKITRKEADIITTDSNYGHLARKVYGLAPVMFCETKDDDNSFVVAVTRESKTGKKINSLAEIKDSNACFPEYGGIAWVSFINVARDHKVLPDSCKYPQIVAKLLRGACTPGFIEANHSLGKLKPRLTSDNLDKLCELCPAQENGERCEANYQNPYYGDKGALDCLHKGAGEIAFLETRNLQAFINNGTIKPNEYRVLCKNGSIAEYTGFDVDRTCALSVTIDSEIVSRRDIKEKELQDTTLALQKIENWLGYRDERRPILIYDRFNDTENLLFKDSTIALKSTKSNVTSILAYKELFSHVDTCSGTLQILAIVTFVIINFVATQLF